MTTMPVIILEETYGDRGPAGAESMRRNIEVVLGHMDRADVAVDAALRSGNRFDLGAALLYRDAASDAFSIASKMSADFFGGGE